MNTSTLENKVSKRERIIESASILFSSKKYHEVMMEDIARSASIAKGTLYNYFSSKDDLYFSIMLTRMDNLFNSLDENIANKNNAVEALHSFVIHNYMFMMKYQCFFKMYQRDNVEIANENAELLNNKKINLRKLLIEIIESGIKDNIFSSHPAGFTADMVLGNIYSAVERGIRKKLDKTGSEDEREKVFQFILKAISNGSYISNLKGKKILITREKTDLKELRLLELFGSQIISFPLINIVPVEDWSEFDRAVSNGNEIDYVIFTSSNAVELFRKRCDELNIELKFDKIKVAVTGSSTAEACRETGIPVDIIPDNYSAEGLLKKISEYDLTGKHIFIPGSKISRKELPEGLEQLGAKLNIVPTYSVEIPDYKNIQDNLLKITYDKPDMFIFTSPSSFKNFLHILNLSDLPVYFSGTVIIAIGPSTKAEIEQYDITDLIVPDEHTMRGIFNSILNYYTSKQIIKE